MSSITDKAANFISRVNPLKDPGFAQDASRALHYNYGPVSILAAFAGSHLLLQHRLPMLFYGLDQNVYPRDDLRVNGEKHVASGKITQAQLRRLKRWEAAHYNAIENLPIFIGSILSLQFAGAPNRLINRVAGVYLSARAAFAALYIFNEDETLAYARTVAWWTGNITCIYGLVKAARFLNHGVAAGSPAL
ncbi:Membrane-associated, eicosanoid/glutathione metabolism (MAPEG) protein [Kalmanozyma brasiliensis GHG001]|uniref:Uncharacterized protein n=1 Tax=Kalmanozyma brasiliensis (strain GHG001) TaxID=1365824 RepID=V5EDX3_KALBG|nr:Membrane-associated, eicosanoid/glutathione metabolism (MAPEG) protein [Kalmanozyma brasiliensis GHG001]EST08666.1 Membrane-associated, eicosanoid/glutathione metabolism (MAPEG) protein [Kalmanozyma brasiliensis GHG001]